jgi:magnesium-transporting ATPase (P-type)
MGESGTDVARQAADIILTDDNFATIVAAIEEGRAVYDNVRKFITYVFASNIPELIPFIAFVLWRIPLPLTVMQILAVDLGTDLFPALALGTEPPEPGVMQRPPRPRSQRLLDGATLARAYLWLGMIEAALCMTAYFATYWLAGWRPGTPLAASGSIYVLATTMSLAGIVFCQVGNALACRSNRESIFRLGLFTNKFLLLGIVAEALILLVLVYTPLLASVFHLIPPDGQHWLILLPFSLILLACEECRKWFAQHWSHHQLPAAQFRGSRSNIASVSSAEN